MVSFRASAPAHGVINRPEMRVSLGDVTAANTADDDLHLVCAITGLSLRTVRRRWRAAHGNTLLRNVYAEVWPHDDASVGQLTLAVARDADLVAEIQALTGLSARAIRRRLNAKHGKMLVGTAFPELYEGAGESTSQTGRNPNDERVTSETLPEASELELLGAARVISARSSVMTRWLARQVGWGEPRMRQLLEVTHGATLIKNVLGDYWPIPIGRDVRDMLGDMRVAPLRRSPSLVLWVARLLGRPDDATARLIERARGTTTVGSVFPGLCAPRTSSTVVSDTEPAPPRAGTGERTVRINRAVPRSAVSTTVGPGVLVTGRWRILAPVGERGGFGAVFAVRDERHPEREYVMKVADGPTASAKRLAEERLQSEVEIAHRLTHQNICAYLVDERDERLGIYFAILKHAGVSLETLIRSGSLDVSAAIDIVSQIAKGLDYAHRRHIVHQDLKPANILVQTVGKHREVRIGDWGIAGQGRKTKRADGNTTVIANVIGRTAGYTAPEHWHGNVRSSSDQYCLALVLCSILDGRIFHSPYEFEGFPALTASQNSVIARALSDEPEYRFASCSEFAKRLREA